MNKEKGHFRRFKVILGVLFLFTLPIYSQNVETVKEIIKMDLPDSMKAIEIEKLIATEKESAGDSLPYLYSAYAYWYSAPNNQLKDWQKALNWQVKAYELSKSQGIQDKKFRQASMRDLGYYYQRNGQERKALSIYKEAISVDQNSDMVVKIYGAMAVAADHINDPFLGIEYLELRLAIEREVASADKLFKSYNNLVGLYRKTRSVDGYKVGQSYATTIDSLATFILQRESDTLKKYTEQYSRYRKTAYNKEQDKAKALQALIAKQKSTIRRHQRKIYSSKTNLAQLFNQHRYSDIDKSIAYYSEALSLANKLKDSTRMSQALFGLGTLNERQNNDYKLSINYYLQGLSFATKQDSLGQYHNQQGLARVYAKKGAYARSIRTREMAIELLTGLGLSDLMSITEEDLMGETRNAKLLTSLTEQAETYLKYYEQVQQPDYLKKSIDHFDLVDRLIDMINLDNRSLASRLFSRRSNATLYTKAIKACYLNNDVEKAFYFMEKSKALLLMEDLARQRYKRTLLLPEKFLEEEEQLKAKVGALERLLSKYSDIGQRDSLNRLLVNTKIALSALTEVQYGADFALALKPEIISLEEVQANLSDHEVVLEYHIPFDEGFGIYTSDDAGFLLSITKSTIELIEIRAISSLKKMVREMDTWFSKPYEVDNDIQSFGQSSNSLFLRLLPTKRIRAQIQGQRVFIVPDGFLSAVPFESLSVRADTLKHLIYESEISYLYSNSFQKELDNYEITRPKVLAMAPGTFSDPEITPLINSEKEMQGVSSQFPGKFFFNKAANKSNFLENLLGADILHLATHADVGESSSPWIAFEDDKIQLEELYLTRNQASLVFLSSCNTALGEEAVGEGLMSLSRGFFHAGAETVISTLWSIDDNATTQIVSDFYKNLHNGQRKSEALRNAKLAYLNTHSLSELSPHFWASFVLHGRDDVLAEETQHGLSIYLTGVFLSISIISIFSIAVKRKVRA